MEKREEDQGQVRPEDETPSSNHGTVSAGHDESASRERDPEDPPEEAGLEEPDKAAPPDGDSAEAAEPVSRAASEEPAEHLPSDNAYHYTDHEYDETYDYGETGGYPDAPAASGGTQTIEQPGGVSGPPAPPVPPAPPAPPPPAGRKEPEPEPEDDEEGGMLRMSFLDHLEELRSRLIQSLMGLGVAFAVAIFFSHQLWNIVRQPAAAALIANGFEPYLAAISPTEQFMVIWLKLPILASIFMASPWVLYQVWSFIAPGLYKRERRWAAPFILVSAGLFILGGMFAYFVAFRFGLVFLLGIGKDEGVKAVISVAEYFDLFVNVMLGIALVFELPVLIFFLTLLRIVSPRWLLANTRYAVLGIVTLAAIITPTPDVWNLMIFTVPMLLLYFVGVFASYLLVLQREKKRFPWFKVVLVIGIVVLLVVVAVTVAVSVYGYRIGTQWPFLVQ